MGAAGKDPGAPLVARQSFDVVATPTLGDAGAPSSLQAPVPFTLVIDPDAGRAFLSSPLRDVPLMQFSSEGFDLDKFAVAGGAPSSTDLEFTWAEVAVSTASLSGMGAGQAFVSCAGCPSFNGPFTATITGAPDVTPPKLVVAPPASPFDPFSVGVSEPLLPTASARLVGEDGTAIDLVPSIVSDDFVSGFSKPNVVLPTGVGLSLDLEEVVDFAGLHASSDPPLRFAVFPTPPLVAQDGFESAMGPTLGGATVITGPARADGSTGANDGGAPLAGTHSVFVSGRCPSSPTPLLVRLAVPAGATKLAFSYQFVGIAYQLVGSATNTVGVGGTVRVGSVGKTVALADVGPAGASDVKTEQVALPADVTSEVLVEIDPLPCGPAAPLLDGIVIDDLRIE